MSKGESSRTLERIKRGSNLTSFDKCSTVRDKRPQLLSRVRYCEIVTDLISTFLARLKTVSPRSGFCQKFNILFSASITRKYKSILIGDFLAELRCCFLVIPLFLGLKSRFLGNSVESNVDDSNLKA